MTVQTYKDKSLMKSERASAPEITKKKWQQTSHRGSVTIEAAFGIPVFLFAALCLVWLIELQSIRISIINAAHNAAKSAAEDTALIPVLNTVKMQSDIISLIGEERIDRSILKGGRSGISCFGSYLSPGTGEMNVTVAYQVQLPLPVFGNPSAKCRETLKFSAWMGYQGPGSGEDDPDIVYLTDHAEVYHRDYQCSYLHLSIKYVPYEELQELRNDSGGKYHACEKCVYGPAMAGVYITEYGDKYHNSLNCSGLKRTIHAVHLSETGGMRGCSRCSG